MGDPLKIHSDCDIVSEQERNRNVCVCQQAVASTALEATAGKMLTINNQRNLVIFPFVGQQPADPNLK